ncbi:Dilute class unconventional myosin [Strongyloides ratti]|uniref:Dilute class unconventional myosin n=1 Tax=Strongyloides ratti TaxID=34506 RepID=A0A090MW57_STRRB|nr:Dilute class unconventional myosin [Strongyloides ratti]CEF63458.1 Dilute class unconventional myosin [Strongyloides ratti]
MDPMCTLGRQEKFPLENYTKGTSVWIRDSDVVWKCYVLLDNIKFSQSTILLQSIDDEDDIIEGKNDLTSLSYLHEPAVLSNLQYRFETLSSIYTYCGIVLVAINPYCDCSNLYGDEVIQVYSGVGKQVRGLDPHIYAISEEAYHDLCEYGKNQSIIVSGESGAGKTVSAKFVMRYLATVASNWKESEKNETGIEKKVLALNPIMEAIGNAKTIRNDNSSRFGKFIKINFNKRRTISGAEMRTYLLETSRVVFQTSDERNYHIFYQICAARNNDILKDLKLMDCTKYSYLYGGRCDAIDGVDDEKEFYETINALTRLGISNELQYIVFKILTAILIIGNINYTEINESIAQIIDDDSNNLLNICANYLSVDSSILKLWLTEREIRCGKELMRKPLTKTEAIINRDALSKLLYSSLFNWIVEQINISLSVEKNNKGNIMKSPNKDNKLESKFVGVLDIYGFETFTINSFEQFCINYANEKLQQQFNQHVFKLEQEEYVREGIEWVRIDFYDNQPCIDLIENRPGIIDYLDEQCKIGRGTDEDWLRSMSTCKNISKNPNFMLPKIYDPSFIVKHFAADVQYKIEGFIEKNKNTINEQLLEVIVNSKSEFIRNMINDSIGMITSGNERKKTVSFKFRESLKDLISVLSSTTPHYVRCIKPNDVKRSFYMESKRSIQQLRACGILETVRLSAAGYPSRMGYEDFSRRYRVLYTEDGKLWKNDCKKFVNITCTKYLENEKFALGKTKIFFRTGQVAQLERLRHERFSSAALIIQCNWRKYQAMKLFKAKKNALLLIQGSLKYFLAYRRIKYLQMYRAAIEIQSRWRGFYHRQNYKKLHNAVVVIQSHYRKNVIRKEYLRQKYENAAITIQKYIRGWLVRREQIERTIKIIKVQCLVRRWLARRKLRELKIEAKSVGHLQKLNKGLENKIISLQQKLDVAVSNMEYKKKYEKMEEEMAFLQNKLDEKEKYINELDKKAKEKENLEILFEKEKQKVVELSEELKNVSLENVKLTKERSECRNELALECSERIDAQKQVEEMRIQLMANAYLMAPESNPVFVDNETMRNDIINTQSKRKNFESSESRERLSKQESGDLHSGENNSPSSNENNSIIEKQMTLLFSQQKIIQKLRYRENELIRRLDEFLSSVEESSATNMYCASYDNLKYKSLESSYNKLKNEMSSLLGEKISSKSFLSNISVFSNFGDKNFKDIFNRLINENEKLILENNELKALLEKYLKSSNITSSKDSRINYLDYDSEDDDSVIASDSYNSFETELNLLREISDLKNRLSFKDKQLDEQITEIEKLHQRIENLTSFISPEFYQLAFPIIDDIVIENKVEGNQNYLDCAGQINNIIDENLSLQEKINKQNEKIDNLRKVSSNENTEYDKDNGICEHNKGLIKVTNIPEFANSLVIGLRAKIIKIIPPLLPANIIFGALRLFDKENDEIGFTSCFTNIHDNIKEIFNESSDFDVALIWFINSWKLLNLLRQYSMVDDKSEIIWFEKNTEQQKLRQLETRIESGYKIILKKHIEVVLTPKIVPAILMHDETKSQNNNDKSLDNLLDFMGSILTKLKRMNADDIIIQQIFSQLTQWVSSLSLNHMLFRKDLCTFERAFIIKHNVTELGDWLKKNKLSKYCEYLEPLIQATHLIQSQKTIKNVEILCGSMTNSLKPRQIISILQHYTPSIDFEDDEPTPEFLAMVKEHLSGREKENDELLLRGTYIEPFNVETFVYTDGNLEDISIPACLRLTSYCKLI